MGITAPGASMKWCVTDTASSCSVSPCRLPAGLRGGMSGGSLGCGGAESKVPVAAAAAAGEPQGDERARYEEPGDGEQAAGEIAGSLAQQAEQDGAEESADRAAGTDDG